MIGVFVREDPALRHIAKWAGISLVTTGLVVNLVLYRAATSGVHLNASTTMTMYGGLAWLFLASYLAFGSVRTRCTSLGMTLPMSTRRLWGAHMSAVATGAGLLLLAAFLVGLFARFSKYVDLTPVDLMSATAHLVALTVLMVVVLDLRAPAFRTIPINRRAVAVTATVLVAALPATLLTVTLPPALALIPLAAAAGIGVRRYRSLPSAFLVTPVAKELEPEADALQWAPAPRSTFSQWMLINSVTSRLVFKKKAAPIITAPFVIFFGVFLAGMDEYWVDDSIRTLVIVMASYMLMAFIIDPMLHVYRVDPFPISRRRVFALLVLVPLITLAIGYGMGRIAVGMVPPRRGLATTVDFCKMSDGTFRTCVPIEICEIRWGDDIPANTAPWGESYTAWSTPVIKGLPVYLYSPYSVGEEASVDFAAWQISRAVESIYGEPITPEEIKRRYLRERADGSPALATEALSIADDFPHLTRRFMGPVFPIVFMLAAVLWLMALRLYMPFFRARRSRRLQKAMGFVIAMGIFLLYILQMVADGSKILQIWVSMGFLQSLARRLGDAFPGSSILVWAVCLGVTALAYLWVERRFAAIEVTPEAARSGGEE